jgi:hypothetical protein
MDSGYCHLQADTIKIPLPPSFSICLERFPVCSHACPTAAAQKCLVALRGAMTTVIKTDGVMNAENAIAWFSMTGKVFEMEIPCVTVRSFLEDRLRVVVTLCSDARGMSVTLWKNFRMSGLVQQSSWGDCALQMVHGQWESINLVTCQNEGPRKRYKRYTRS